MTVPEVEHLHHVAVLVDAVVDHDRGVDQLPDARPAEDRTADVREAAQQLKMIEDCAAEPFGGLREGGPGVFDDLLEIR